MPAAGDPAYSGFLGAVFFVASPARLTNGFYLATSGLDPTGLGGREKIGRRHLQILYLLLDIPEFSQISGFARVFPPDVFCLNALGRTFVVSLRASAWATKSSL